MISGFRNQIDVTLSLADGAIAGVEMMPRTRPPLGRMFAGKSPDALLAALPRLFTLCAGAHHIACLSALEAARGENAGSSVQQRRVTAVLVERLLELLRGLVLGPLLREGVPLPEARGLIQAMARLDRHSGRPGPEVLAQIRTALAAIGIGRGSELVAATSPLASLPERAWGRAHDASFLSPSDDPAILARLLDQLGFAAKPDLDGRVPETGVWARHATRVGSAPSAGPVARLHARLAEIVALLRRLEDDAGGAGEAGIVAAYPLGPGRGAAAVECARGRLHHAVELDSSGQIARFEFLAPTEWNFHPRGPLTQALVGIRLSDRDPERDRPAVEAMVGAFDPCVGVRVAFAQEFAHA